MTAATWTTRRPRRTRRGRGLAAVLAAAAAVALAGCGADLPQPNPEPAPAVAPPALADSQVDAILADLGSVLTAADAARDPQLLTSRVAGPALAIRSAEYQIATATQDASAVTVIPSAAQAVVVPDSTTWPRTFYVVTEQPEGLASPLLLTLRQADPRSRYVLWSWARLLPGVKMPPTADPEIGSLPLEPDAPGLLVAPKDVAGQYADVLTHGDASAFAATFAPDAFRSALSTALAAISEAVKDVGSVAETYAAVDGGTTAVATADGGALVISELTTVSTFTLTSGKLTLTGDTAALLGRAEVGSNVAVTYAGAVAFFVPPAGSDQQVQVLAAEHAQTQVTGA